jgi:hypothetical protein
MIANATSGDGECGHRRINAIGKLAASIEGLPSV